MTTEDNAPNSIPWPPLLLAGLGLLAALLTYYAPLWYGYAGLSRGMFAVGITIFLVGISLDIWSAVTMSRARTNILPTRPADRLVTHGPFAYSRNPIYLGNALMLAGFAIAFQSIWFGLAAALNALLVHHLAIRREETHLAEKFGGEWTAYCASVPRWI